MSTRLERAYAAGFFDGEGSAYFMHDRRTDNLFGTVTVAQSDPGVLEWMQGLWGGRIYRRGPAKAHWHPVYALVIRGARLTTPFLNEIRPYLRVKAEKVDAYLKITRKQLGRYGAGRDRKGRLLGYTAERRDEIRQLYLEFQSLPISKHREPWTDEQRVRHSTWAVQFHAERKAQLAESV
jgi:hypothetical protein